MFISKSQDSYHFDSLWNIAKLNLLLWNIYPTPSTLPYAQTSPPSPRFDEFFSLGPLLCIWLPPCMQSTIWAASPPCDWLSQDRHTFGATAAWVLSPSWLVMIPVVLTGWPPATLSFSAAAGPAQGNSTGFRCCRRRPRPYTVFWWTNKMGWTPRKWHKIMRKWTVFGRKCLLQRNSLDNTKNIKTKTMEAKQTNKTN